MEALQAALASLVALEARAFELVSPVEAIADAVKAVVKEAAIVVESLHGRVTELEQLESRVAALEARVVAEGPKVASAAPSAPAADVATTDKSVSDAPGAVTFVDEPPAAAAAPVRSDPLAGAPDVAKVFGFDAPSAETTGT